MEMLTQYGLFLAETITIVIAFITIILVIASTASRNKHVSGHIEIKKLDEKFKQYKNYINAVTLPKHLLKKNIKQEKQQHKKDKKQSKKEPDKTRKRVFILDFHGDLRASAVQSLREEISAILTAVNNDDEVLVRLESPGGLVHAYGLAASQLTRLREKGVQLTISVDKVAASGGYLMACVASRILAAPFAIVGSIGVIAQLPNFHRLLKKHDIDYELLTAGEYKRTLTIFGKNTDKARQKFLEDIEDIHILFKEFIHKYRPQMDLDQVATGEHWPAIRAIDFKLIDEIKTSDDYLFELSQDHDLFEVKYAIKKPISKRISLFAQNLLDKLVYNTHIDPLK